MHTRVVVLTLYKYSSIPPDFAFQAQIWEKLKLPTLLSADLQPIWIVWQNCWNTRVCSSFWTKHLHILFNRLNFRGSWNMQGSLQQESWHISKFMQEKYFVQYTATLKKKKIPSTGLHTPPFLPDQPTRKTHLPERKAWKNSHFAYFAKCDTLQHSATNEMSSDYTKESVIIHATSFLAHSTKW